MTTAGKLLASVILAFVLVVNVWAGVGAFRAAMRDAQAGPLCPRCHRLKNGRRDPCQCPE